MRGNAEQCHLKMNTKKLIGIKLGRLLIVISDCEKTLAVKIDYKLNFDEHVKTLCRANNKLRALARAMSVEKNKILITIFSTHSFNC